jgi:hypothetical protein
MPVDQGFDYPTMPDVDYPSSPAPDSPALDAQLPNPVNDTPADPSQQTVENPERSHPLSPIIARCAPASPVRSIQPARKSDQDLAKEQYEAFWKPLDPHANSQLQSRPFRKGQISRSFKLVERIIQERNSKSRYPPPSILEFLSGKQQSVNSSHVQQKSSANSIDLDGLEFEGNLVNYYYYYAV